MTLRWIFLLSALLSGQALAAQTCRTGIRETAPASRFLVDAGRGTVLDLDTGLMWRRCAEGLDGPECTLGALDFLTWGNALSAAADSQYAGYSDWRLPNLKEMQSLLELSCLDPALNLKVFPNAPVAQFWTSSPGPISYNAWYVYSGQGEFAMHNMDDKFFQLAVWLVRGEP